MFVISFRIYFRTGCCLSQARWKLWVWCLNCRFWVLGGSRGALGDGSRCPPHTSLRRDWRTWASGRFKTLHDWNMPPKGVILTDFIRTFAILCFVSIENLFFFATLRQVIFWHDKISNNFLLLRILKVFIYVVLRKLAIIWKDKNI